MRTELYEKLPGPKGFRYALFVEDDCWGAVAIKQGREQHEVTGFRRSSEAIAAIEHWIDEQPERPDPFVTIRSYAAQRGAHISIYGLSREEFDKLPGAEEADAAGKGCPMWSKRIPIGYGS